MFSFLPPPPIYVLSISLKKMFILFFFFFFYMLCSTVFKLPFFSSLSFFHCPVPFSFSFYFPFFFIINCPFTVSFFFFFFFFLNLISASLCLYLNTRTIVSLPSLFNFNRKNLNSNVYFMADNHFQSQDRLFFSFLFTGTCLYVSLTHFLFLSVTTIQYYT